MHLLHLILPCLVALGAAYLMMLAGISKHALRPRHARRICPSCGRSTRDCICRR